MKIKKIGHCCLVIETNGKRVMTDPGTFTIEEQVQEKNIDIVLITHEHGDHFHIDSLKKILAHNPEALVVTNTSVGTLLSEAGIPYDVLEDRAEKILLGVEIEAHDCPHEEIFEDIGQVQNTGFFIGRKLFYPGDAYYNPGKPVEILALPVAGPWSRARDFMKYVLDVKPAICFPVHDGMLKTPESSYFVPKMVLPKRDIEFKTLELGVEEEF